MKTLTKIIISVIITILIISTVFYEIAEIPKTETKKLEYLPIKYEFHSYVNAYNITIYYATVINNYSFPVYVYEKEFVYNQTYYQKLEVWQQIGYSLMYSTNIKEPYLNPNPTNYESSGYGSYYVMIESNYFNVNNTNIFCLYGIQVLNNDRPTKTVTYTLVNYTLDTEVTFRTLNARTTSAVISAPDTSKNEELISANEGASTECYIVLNNGTTIQIVSSYNVTLLNNNGNILQSTGKYAQPSTETNTLFYSYWIWSSDTPENTFLNAYTFLTVSGSNIVVPTPINAYINITSYAAHYTP